MDKKKAVKKAVKKVVKKVADKSSLFVVVYKSDDFSYLDAKMFKTLLQARACVAKMKKYTDYRKPTQIAIYKKTV